MIKRYIKLLVALIIVAIIALVSYFGVSAYKENQSKKALEEEAKKVIFNFDINTIEGLKINSKGDYYRFDISGDQWVLSEGEKLQVNSAKLVNISNAICSLIAVDIITEDAQDDLSKYGLDEPIAVSAILDNHEEKSIDIGRQVPGSTDYYAKVPGENTIYIISQESAESISAERKDLKDDYLFDALKSSDVYYMKYIEKGKVIYDLQKNSDNTWKLITPFPQGKVNAASVDTIISTAIRAKAVTFIDEELNDLSKFGFDNPQYQFEIKTDYKSANVIFGNYYDEKQQYIYGYNKDLDQIYIFETAYLGFIGGKTEDVLVKYLTTNVYFGDLKGFDVNIFGTQMDIEYIYAIGENTEKSYGVNGKNIDYENQDILDAFNLLINSITGMTFESIRENVSKAELEKTPDATVKFLWKDGTEYKLEFIQTSDNKDLFYIVENGVYIDVLARRYVLESGILKYYNDLMAMIE